MKTITDKHRQRLREKHDSDPEFGVIGHLWASRVYAYMTDMDCSSMLDYGSGRAKLVAAVAERWAQNPYLPDFKGREYEPAFNDPRPAPACFVTCIDVLEHVERDMLDNVLADIRRCTERAGLITISLRNSARKSIHPIVETREWWTQTISAVFPQVQEVEILDPAKTKSEIAFLVRMK